MSLSGIPHSLSLLILAGLGRLRPRWTNVGVLVVVVVVVVVDLGNVDVDVGVMDVHPGTKALAPTGALLTSKTDRMMDDCNMESRCLVVVSFFIIVVVVVVVVGFIVRGDCR